LIARRALEHRGWSMLATNYRFGRKEVDIIARLRETVVFVEVKTRSYRSTFHPEEAVTWSKRKAIEIVARDFLCRYHLTNAVVRFDVVCVEITPDGPVTCHIEDAWRPGWF